MREQREESVDDYSKALIEGIDALSIGNNKKKKKTGPSRKERRRKERLPSEEEIERRRRRRSPEPSKNSSGGGGNVLRLEEGSDFDEDELDAFLHRALNISEAELSSMSGVFKDAHDLTYEHCLLRSDGNEAASFGGSSSATTAGASTSSGSLFNMCIPDAAPSSAAADIRDADDYEEEASSGLPDPNVISGDERLELFRRLLDEFNWERQDNQVDFHEMMIKTALPCIFKDEWDADYDRILRLFGLYQHCAETFIVCPRRFGKTVAVAMFCAVYMYVIPDASIAIFSTAQRTSGKMMLAIYEFMRELPYFRDAVFHVKNSETISITLNGVKRTMWCYPGKVGVRSLFVIFFSFARFFSIERASGRVGAYVPPGKRAPLLRTR
jgi:hypothetical protein